VNTINEKLRFSITGRQGRVVSRASLLGLMKEKVQRMQLMKVIIRIQGRRVRMLSQRGVSRGVRLSKGKRSRRGTEGPLAREKLLAFLLVVATTRTEVALTAMLVGSVKGKGEKVRMRTGRNMMEEMMRVLKAKVIRGKGIRRIRRVQTVKDTDNSETRTIQVNIGGIFFKGKFHEMIRGSEIIHIGIIMQSIQIKDSKIAGRGEWTCRRRKRSQRAGFCSRGHG
jgi:hypothetical protein